MEQGGVYSAPGVPRKIFWPSMAEVPPRGENCFSVQWWVYITRPARGPGFSPFKRDQLYLLIFLLWIYDNAYIKTILFQHQCTNVHNRVFCETRNWIGNI